MALWTAEIAREMARRSHAPGSARFKKLEPPQPIPQPAEPLPDNFALTLAYACDDTLDRIIKTANPQARAQLARALRDLRETWHMATGKPKPGMTRPESGPQRRAVMPRVWPTAPNPGPAPTTNGVPEPAPDPNLPKP